MTRVYVDMVADDFGAGHVEFLRKARALGDELVVGLPSDDDCEWFHGRPTMNLDQRARIVLASPQVDGVLTGVPVFVTHSWLQAQRLDLVAHSEGLSERSLRYWYRVPIELGIFRTIPVSVQSSRVDLEGRLLVGEAPTPGPRSLLALTRRRLRRWLPPVDKAVRRRALIGGLHRLADALRGTPIEGRYWLVGGLLLGWAREGRPLASDLDDADFAYLDEDHERFLASIPAIVSAGLQPKQRFSSADGRYVEHRFFRDGVQFEFFRLRRSGDRWRYSMFILGNEPTELIAEVPAQSHVSFQFVGRTWRKVIDHELALRTIYGDCAPIGQSRRLRPTARLSSAFPWAFYRTVGHGRVQLRTGPASAPRGIVSRSQRSECIQSVAEILRRGKVPGPEMCGQAKDIKTSSKQF